MPPCPTAMPKSERCGWEHQIQCEHSCAGTQLDQRCWHLKVNYRCIKSLGWQEGWCTFWVSRSPHQSFTLHKEGMLWVSLPALCTFSAAPRGALAALELHFLELPSAPPPGVSCQKHELLPAGVGAVNPSVFAGSLRSQIKIGHRLKFSKLTSWYWNQRSHRKGRFPCFYSEVFISAGLCVKEHSLKANPF